MNFNQKRTCLTLAGALALFASAPASGLKVVSHHPTTTAYHTAGKLKSSTARYIKAKNQLVFAESSVRLVVLTGPANDMLSYRIDGKRNPELVFRPGAILHILFVNMDDDMNHDLRFLPGWPSKFDKVKPNSGVGSAILAPHAKTVAHAEELVVKVPSQKEKDSYLCSVTGHAQGGMVGHIIIQ